MRQRQSGAPLAATNVKTAGCACKRRDALRLGRKEGLQPRANERPAVGCSEKLGGVPRRAARSDRCSIQKHGHAASARFSGCPRRVADVRRLLGRGSRSGPLGLRYVRKAVDVL